MMKEIDTSAKIIFQTTDDIFINSNNFLEDFENGDLVNIDYEKNYKK